MDQELAGSDRLQLIRNGKGDAGSRASAQNSGHPFSFFCCKPSPQSTSTSSLLSFSRIVQPVKREETVANRHGIPEYSQSITDTILLLAEHDINGPSTSRKLKTFHSRSPICLETMYQTKRSIHNPCDFSPSKGNANRKEHGGDSPRFCLVNFFLHRPTVTL